MHLKYSPLGTIHSEMTAVKRFSRFLKRKYLDIQSLQEIRPNAYRRVSDISSDGST